MFRVIFAVSLLCATVASSADWHVNSQVSPADCVPSRAFLPAEGESTVTRIAPVQQPYGVGTVGSNGPTCLLADEPESATFSGGGVGGIKCVWVVWDLGSVPGDAEVLRVEIEHELTPYIQNHPDVRMHYKGLSTIYMPPPECYTALGVLVNGPLYTDVEMGTSAGTRRHVLEGSAAQDAEGQLSRRGMFSVGIVAPGDIEVLGSASLPGWNAGGPDLLVTWRDPSPVGRVSWGMLKALFRP